jgi:hypothetical protein
VQEAEDIEKNNDGDRHSEKPKHDTLHGNLAFPIARRSAIARAKVIARRELALDRVSDMG